MKDPAPSASPLDPVAALAPDQCPACWHVHRDYSDEPCVSCGCNFTAELEAVAEQGYVLVNADMLAAALQGDDGTGSFQEEAERLLAALKGPAR